MERLEFRLDRAPALRCVNAGSPIPFCETCETCILSSKVSFTKEWFQRAGETSKRKFVTGILHRFNSSDLLAYTERLLRPTLGKDFTYSRSRINPGLPEDLGVFGSDRALDKKMLAQAMLETWEWFKQGTYWTKANYSLQLLRLCHPDLLRIAANLIHVLLVRDRHASSAKSEAKDKMEDNGVSIPVSHYALRSEEHPELELLVQTCPENKALTSDMVYEKLSTSASSETSSGKEETRISVSGTSRSKNLWVQAIKRYLDEKKEPVDDYPDPPDEPALMLVPTSYQSSSGLSQFKDFIRCLPVHLSKYILGLLDKDSLSVCLHVCLHWRYLGEEIQKEKEVQIAVQNEAMILQGTSPKGVSPSYAKIRKITFPVVSEDGDLIPNPAEKYRLRKLDNLEEAYFGLHTDTVLLEERNLYCGSYNVLVLTHQGDPKRVIHYNGGRLVALGSIDRKVRFLDVSLMEDVPPVIHGHAGSVRAVFLCEEKGFVLSGSFDLSIRYWNLHTGACMRIFYGHTGTITCLDLHMDKLVSGAKDCKVKVWLLDLGLCIRTFKHQSVILCVKINEEYVISGCMEGLVKVWHISSATLIKTLKGHQGPIKCLSFDNWHLVSGSCDGYAMAWSMMGPYKRCLMTFRHPKEVLCLKFLYLRVITGCKDGKIRIFNFLNGDCLRVMRANSRADPVASFCITGNRMVINVLTSILIYQFEEVQWDYTIEAEREEVPKERDKFKKAPVRTQPYSFVRAQRMKRVGSSNVKIYQKSEKGETRLSHHARSLSAKSRKTAQSLHLQSLKPVPWSEIANFHRSSAYIDLQPEFFKKRPSAIRLLTSSRSSHEAANRTTSTPALAPKAESDTESSDGSPGRKSALSLSEEATLQRIRKRGPHGSMSPNRILLTVGMLHHSQKSDILSSNIEHNANIRDAWGPPASIQEQKRHAPKAPEDQKIDPLIHLKQLREAGSNEGLKKISTPFEVKRLGLNLKRSLHRPEVPSSIPAPCIVRAKSCFGNWEQKARTEQKKTVSMAPTQAERTDNLRSSVLTQEVSMVMGRPTKAPSLKTKNSEVFVTANPYREKSGFQLMTVKQMKEYREERALHYQTAQAKILVYKQKESKNAWLRKIKGLAIDDFTKEGKIAAPELGPDVFI
ncbi:CMT1A duplicated region transcript 1 protein [Microcaecilia unicolor]|uniref:CMT1A duplicated region transcript 1 protein-like n=1 Tax=Microcaecilia unicolor TaxID=1415580 RepID=A0A6P7YGA5_9AMPH|nr:CMT1A duplicated region transcript 1 protein-like [Microcaecilia unicolor]